MNCHKEYETYQNYLNRNTFGNFCSKKCYNEYRRVSIDYSKKYRTMALKYYDHKCENCGWSNGIVDCLDVHHIDENHQNNNIENLIILCPTCHSIITRGWGKIINRKMQLFSERHPKEKEIFLLSKDEAIHKLKMKLDDLKKLDLTQFGVYAQMARKWNVSPTNSRQFILKISKKLADGKSEDEIIDDLIKFTPFKKDNSI